MKKRMFLMMIMGFIFAFSGCSRIIDALWNPNTASFELQAVNKDVNTSLASGQIQLKFTKSDHLNYRTSGANSSDKYYWGYYIYKNTVSPYDTYALTGIEAQEVLTGSGTDTYHSTYQKIGGSASAFDTGSSATSSRSYVDSCSAIGHYYYYRVVVVYREWDKSGSGQWKNYPGTGETSDEDKSTFAKVLCK